MKIHKKSQLEGAIAGGNGNRSRKRASSSPMEVDQETETSELSSTIITSNSSSWPANGAMMVTLDNGTVVSFVTAGDGLHSPGSVLELNSEQHAQLINAVAVQQSSNHSSHTETYVTSHFHTSDGNQAELIHEATIDCTEEEFAQGVKKPQKILYY
jgi:hypothetical protein